MGDTKSKVCTKCGEEKLLDEFWSSKRAKDGKLSKCKDCLKKWRNEHADEIEKWREEHKDKLKTYREIYNKKYNKEHKEQKKISSKKHYLQNKEKIINRAKIYYSDHKKEKKEYIKKYQEEHKDELKIYKKKYQEEHKKQNNKHANERRKTDINFKISGNLRSRVRLVLKGNTKSASTIKLLGCPVEFLIAYLQSKFTKGMTWENHGRGWGDKGLKEWHIDHIKPCSKFDLSKESEQRKCFHYSNLQPLWALDNLSKTANFIEENQC